MISENGEQLGVVSVKEGIERAHNSGLDLVEVATNAKPPVCKIMDYGKYKYEQSKKEKEARKNQKIINVKEVKFRIGIEEHDFNVKVKNAKRFLTNGDKVKVTIMFRGREISHSDLGKELCDKTYDVLKDIAKIEKTAKVEGRNMIMVLAPKQ